MWIPFPSVSSCRNALLLRRETSWPSFGLLSSCCQYIPPGRQKWLYRDRHLQLRRHPTLRHPLCAYLCRPYHASLRRPYRASLRRPYRASLCRPYCASLLANDTFVASRTLYIAYIYVLTLWLLIDVVNVIVLLHVVIQKFYNAITLMFQLIHS